MKAGPVRDRERLEQKAKELWDATLKQIEEEAELDAELDD